MRTQVRKLKGLDRITGWDRRQFVIVSRGLEELDLDYSSLVVKALVPVGTWVWVRVRGKSSGSSLSAHIPSFRSG